MLKAHLEAAPGARNHVPEFDALIALTRMIFSCHAMRDDRSQANSNLGIFARLASGRILQVIPTSPATFLFFGN
jgi:hypothetical protein